MVVYVSYSTEGCVGAERHIVNKPKRIVIRGQDERGCEIANGTRGQDAEDELCDRAERNAIAVPLASHSGQKLKPVFPGVAQTSSVAGRGGVSRTTWRLTRRNYLGTFGKARASS